MSAFIEKLNKANEVYNDMNLLVSMCQTYKGNLDMWEIHWDSFWELSGEFPFKVDWYDPDTSYEEDIMQRYLAIASFIQDYEVGSDE